MIYRRRLRSRRPLMRTKAVPRRAHRCGHAKLKVRIRFWCRQMTMSVVGQTSFLAMKLSQALPFSVEMPYWLFPERADLSELQAKLSTYRLLGYSGASPPINIRFKRKLIRKILQANSQLSPRLT